MTDPDFTIQLRQILHNFNALAARRDEMGADSSFESGIAVGLEMALEAATGVRGAQKLVDDLEPGDRVWTSGIGSGYWHTVAATSHGRMRCECVVGAYHEVVHVEFTDGTTTAVQEGFTVRVAADDCTSTPLPFGAPMEVGAAVSAWANGTPR